MIFQHTISSVLNRTKTQTSRIWKDNYLTVGNGPSISILSAKTKRPLYYVGQRHAIQPARGKKGVGYIELTSVLLSDVQYFDDADIKREGFTTKQEFIELWEQMHGNNYCAMVIQFKVVSWLYTRLPHSRQQNSSLHQ